MKRLAVVTGGNRGLGFEACRQLAKKGIDVILTSRDAKKGQAAADELKSAGLPVTFHQLDVNSEESISALKNFIEKEHGKLDILVNNAGVMIDRKNNGDEYPSVLKAELETFRQTMESNVFGVLRLCQVFIPLMKKNNYGRIVNVSSGMGQLSYMSGGWPAYRVSKTALNSLTAILAYEVKDTNILINSVCPGWVKTEMGGPNATRNVEEGVDTMVYLATLPDNGPRGKLLRDRQIIAW
ncbi:MAG: SDR family oxidoreductase [Candidatus Obscuribacterales bacterium]|nr:SDR family oxidoreductase [Candidatus Obscuribacterales bacterium]